MDLNQPSSGVPTPEAVRGLVEVHSGDEARSDVPALRASGLPGQYIPKVAGYARGSYVAGLVTPSAWRWRNTRTVVVTNDTDGLNYRAIRVYDTRRTPEFIGYWAIELLGTPLTELEAK